MTTATRQYLLLKAYNNNVSSYNQVKKKEAEDAQSAKSESGKKTFKYRLVGAMIQVILVVNGEEKRCIKSIPVEKAPPRILAKVENLTLLDRLMISELKNRKHKPLEHSDNLSKEHAEYEKHFMYESTESMEYNLVTSE